VKRTVSTAHLVFGIIFSGITLLWLIAQATDANIHDTAPGFPLVLIGAGVIGLVATLANSRNRRQAFAAYAEQARADEADTTDQPAGDDTEDTTVLQEES